VKYYNFAPIFNVNKGFSFQTGDPIGPPQGDGGTSIWGLISGRPEDHYFPAEIHPKLKHTERGTVSMAVSSEKDDDDDENKGVSGSQFFITLGDELDSLDGKYTIFGRVAEGFDTLEKINDAYCDDKGRPYRDIRLKHTIVLEDPFPDPPGLEEPPESPVPSKAQLATVRLGEEEKDEAAGKTEEELEILRRNKEAKANALTLEIIGDLPYADVSPPENILFVAKLNPATQDEDLELIFSRFGKILSCEVIRDKQTGDSLQYAFIEFQKPEDCEMAYFKMQDVLIDDKRIKVDFSQSTSKYFAAWRDEENRKRKESWMRKSGYAGAEQLERRSHFREGGREKNGHGYVFDDEELREQGRRKDRRDYSPNRRRDGDGRRDRDDGYHGDDRKTRYDGERERERDRDKRRFDDRDRDRGRDHNRDRERERERERGYSNRHRDRDRKR
jgi:peptidyl-prolyl cis-trans isomerase-like 4